MSLEENKAVVRRYIQEGVNKRDLAVVEELVADEKMKHDVHCMLDDYSDFQMVILDMIAEGDKVAVRLVGRGTDAVSGRMVEVPGNTFYRVVEGRIVGFWPQVDSLAMMQQVGLVPEDLHR